VRSNDRDGAVYTKVENAYAASYGIENPGVAISVLAQSAMRKEVCVRVRVRGRGRGSTTTLAQSVTRKEAGTLKPNPHPSPSPNTLSPRV
jgi:hypothetical protein